MRTWSSLTAGPGWQRAALLTGDMPAATAFSPAGHAWLPGVSQLAASMATRLITMSAVGGHRAAHEPLLGRPGTCSVPGIASCRVSLVTTANRDPRLILRHECVCSIRSRARCWQPGSIIMAILHGQRACSIPLPPRSVIVALRVHAGVTYAACRCAWITVLARPLWRWSAAARAMPRPHGCARGREAWPTAAWRGVPPS